MIDLIIFFLTRQIRDIRFEKSKIPRTPNMFGSRGLQWVC